MQSDHHLNLLSPEAPQILYDLPGCSGKAVEDQCDCACATTLLPFQPVKDLASIPYGMRSDIGGTNFSLTDSFLPIPLTPGYSAVLARHLPATTVFNQSALNMAYHFDHARLLTDVPLLWYKLWGETVVQTTLAQMITLGLLLPEKQTIHKLAKTPVTLSAWLHITDRCNLRCAYCYLPHQRVDMSLATGRAVVEATFRSAVVHDFQQVKFKYAGGEPMLRFPFVTELHRHAQALADRHGLSLEGIVLSNGTLLNKQIVETMNSLGIRLMISLDGLGDSHDCQRFYADGHGSFADVEQAIELALTHNLIPDISITVSVRNAAGLPKLIEWILARNLPFSLNFYRENDFSTTHKDLKLAEDKIIAGMLAAFKVIETNLPRRNLLASLVDRANLAAPHLHTCGVGHSYLVFNHLGQVAKCQMHINQTVTTAQIADPLAFIRNDAIGIQNISVEEKEGCRNCEWKYWCTGGCPLATYRATGRYDVKSPNCSIYKTLYPEAVRLEGLRLLKYANEIEKVANQ